MPGIMFTDVVSSRMRSHRKWYTVPLSFLVHTSILALLIVAPLIATHTLPKPRTIMEFVTPYVIVAPAMPPPLRRSTDRAPIARPTLDAPVIAPDMIGVESGIVFQPGEIATGDIDSVFGGVDGVTGVGHGIVDVLPPAPPPSHRLVVGGDIKPPARTRYVAPKYPEMARANRVQGVVIIEAVIGADGRVEQARVLRSQPLLDEAALAAVRAWEYTPTLLNKRPTAVVMTVTVQFSLK
jgi:TonB family protein